MTLLCRSCLDLFSIHHQIASPAPKPISTVEFPGQRNHLKVKVSMEHPGSVITWKQCMTKRFIYLVNVTALKSTLVSCKTTLATTGCKKKKKKKKKLSSSKICWFRGFNKKNYAHHSKKTPCYL